ncbi:hypothetical protein [Tsuneonella flava]|uniref:hypothetical protein n=1 Tax=Tsuneonella flava TaxID=2055955 RepID=UPI0018E43535|nr:hypothetical protein [Tsuneonella flava]
MENPIIVETKADDLWGYGNQRPREVKTLHAQSRAGNAGFQTPVFCIGDLGLSL